MAWNLHQTLPTHSTSNRECTINDKFSTFSICTRTHTYTRTNDICMYIDMRAVWNAPNEKPSDKTHTGEMGTSSRTKGIEQRIRLFCMAKKTIALFAIGVVRCALHSCKWKWRKKSEQQMKRFAFTCVNVWNVNNNGNGKN